MKTIVIAMGLSTGCYFHAVSGETTATRYERGLTIVAGDGLEIGIAATAREIRVTAAKRQECVEQTFAVTTTTRKKQVKFESADLSGPGDLGPAAIVVVPVIAVAAVIGIVSGIAAAAEAGADHGDSWESGRVIAASTSAACGGAIAGVAIEIELPSGARRTATTDDAGMATFAITGEAAGRVIARASGITQRGMYYPDRAACNADRLGRDLMSGTLPSCEANTDGERAVEQAWALVNDVASSAHGDCAAAIGAAEALAKRAPTLFEQVVETPAYARCVETVAIR